MNKTILKTANGNYMSEIYYMTGKDFETQHLSDAKVFDSLEDAKEYIIECKFDNAFVWAEKLEIAINSIY